MTPSPKNETTLVVLIFGLSFLFAFLVAEIGLRFTDYKYLLNAAYGFPKGYYIPDDQTGMDLAQNFPAQLHEFQGDLYPVHTNSLGCFDVERPIPDDYVLAMGDSWTWGYTPLAQKWTSLLEAKRGWPIMKCGMAGSGTREQLLRTQRLIERTGHAPRLIILMYNALTDVNDDYLLPSVKVVNGCRLSVFESLDFKTGEVRRRTDAELAAKFDGVDCDFSSRHTMLGQVRKHLTQSVMFLMVKQILVPRLRSMIHAKQGDDFQMRNNYERPIALAPYYDPSKPWMVEAIQKNQESLRGFIQLAKEQKARLLLIDQNGDLSRPLMAAIMQDIKAAPFVHYYNLGQDFAPLKAADPLKYHWKFDDHWNPEGNRMAAELIDAYIQKEGLAKPLDQLR